MCSVTEKTRLTRSPPSGIELLEHGIDPLKKFSRLPHLLARAGCNSVQTVDLGVPPRKIGTAFHNDVGCVVSDVRDGKVAHRLSPSCSESCSRAAPGGCNPI